MTSIDHRDAEVQQTFTSLRKAVNESDRHSLVGQISKMYEQNDDYSFGVDHFSCRFSHGHCNAFPSQATDKNSGWV